MKRWQALAALGGLFVLGVVSGGLGAHLYYARALERPPAPPPFFGGPGGPRFERILELTPEQRREVRRILDERHSEAERLRRELAPRLHELMERGDREISELLTPEQRERFERLQHRMQRRSERFYGGPPRHRPPRRRPPPAGG